MKPATEQQPACPTPAPVPATRGPRITAVIYDCPCGARRIVPDNGSTRCPCGVVADVEVREDGF